MGIFGIYNMIQEFLRNKYGKYLASLDIYENKSSLRLSKIVIKDEFKGSGIGTQILNDLIVYADKNKQIITLTPSADFGGNKNRLIQFYKRFGFKHNKGVHINHEYSDTMIRYPKLNEMKTLIKQLLRERLLTKDETDVKDVADFVNFAKKFLGITDDIKVQLAYERTPDLVTTAYYDPTKKILKVYVKDRAIIDVCRSIAHELVHHQQTLEGRLTDPKKNGEDGSPIENEANAVAGIIIRKYGKIKPELYI